MAALGRLGWANSGPLSLVSGSAGVSPAAVGVSPTAFLPNHGLGETPSPATGTVALPETVSNAGSCARNFLSGLARRRCILYIKPPMSPDNELLRRYAQQGDEAAFAEVVRRHTDLVYSAG